MSPFSGPVLGAAAVLSGPALWGAFVAGTTTTDAALTRFAVAAVLVWLALGALAALVGPAPRRPVTGEDEAERHDPAVAPLAGDAPSR